MKNYILAIASIISLVFTGCISDTSGIFVEKGRLIIHNQRLAAHVELTHHLRRDTQTGFAHVQAILQNVDYGDVQFQYRFEWYDKDGMLIEETSPMWHTVRIHGKDLKVLEAVSENRQAADFRLVIRDL